MAVRGVNGLGKTTLLKTILGMTPPLAGTIRQGDFLQPGYFEQEERVKNEKTALEDVWDAYPGLTNAEVRAALAGCGLTNEHITTKVFVLSGGEAAKVRDVKRSQLAGAGRTHQPSGRGSQRGTEESHH